jgi:hypothetical protein
MIAGAPLEGKKEMLKLLVFMLDTFQARQSARVN